MGGRHNSSRDLLLSPTHAMVEKVLFLGQIFGMEILMDLHVMKFPKFENHIFSVWSVYLFVCYQHQKQIAAETSNLIFYICTIYRYYLKHFIKIESKLCVQGHTKEF